MRMGRRGSRKKGSFNGQGWYDRFTKRAMGDPRFDALSDDAQTAVCRLVIRSHEAIPGPWSLEPRRPYQTIVKTDILRELVDSRWVNTTANGFGPGEHLRDMLTITERVEFSKELRRQVYRRDGFKCRYCGKRPRPIHLDHIIPVCQGGSNHPDNLVTACPDCNLKKGGRTPEEAGMTLLPIPTKGEGGGWVEPT